MKRIFISSLLSILASMSNNANSQSLAWAKQMESSAGGEASSVAVDAGGNVYTAGSFYGTNDFDPGAGIHNLTAFSSNGDIFVSKLDPFGNFIWAKQMGGTTFISYAYSIAVDADGNIYSTGYFSGTIDFDPGASTYNLTAPGEYDVYVSKLDSSGNFVWAKQFSAGSGNTDYGYSITVDDSENVYTAGSLFGTTDFDPGAGTYNLTSSGGNDIFISKLNASGNFVWAKRIGGTANDESRSLALDNSGNIYTTGIFSGTVDFDPGTGTYYLSSSSSSDVDMFVFKLDHSGNFAWAKQVGGSSYSQIGYSIAVDTNANVYTTGSFSGTADFDPGTGTYILSSIANQGDIFVSKLDSSGNFLWAKQMGGALSDVGFGIAVDASGNAYTTGYFNNSTADFDPDTSATYYLTSFGGKDIFISKLDSSGNFIWAGQLGGPDYDDGSGITVDAGGNIYAAGDFRSTADLDPGGGTYYLTCPSFTPNIFVVKLSDFTTGIAESNTLPGEITISPNPFSGSTTISISLMKTEQISVNIVDVNGRPVDCLVEGELTQGQHRLEYRSASMNAGIYFLQLRTPSSSESKKIIMSR